MGKVDAPQILPYILQHLQDPGSPKNSPSIFPQLFIGSSPTDPGKRPPIAVKRHILQDLAAEEDQLSLLCGLRELLAGPGCVMFGGENHGLVKAKQKSKIMIIQ